MKTVKEVSKISGVSVRALHHYDAIGLLKPTSATEAGYRLYDDAALARLQSILLFRELEFPLKEIRTILDEPNFDSSAALEQQIGLLELKARHIQKLIDLARDTMRTGVNKMDFSAFDKTEIEQYAIEARKKWGNTAAYHEYENKTKVSGGKMEDFTGDMMKLFGEMGRIKHLSPDSDEAQAAVKNLQQFISEHCYNCTVQILSVLGQMYTLDERFRKNIDACGGKGTAEFVSKAIEIYCSK